MAFLTFVRNLKLYRSQAILCFSSQIAHSLPHRSVSSQYILPSALPSSFQAFRRTTCRPCTQTPPLGSFHHTESQIFYQFFNFDKEIDEAHGDMQLEVNEIIEKVQKAKDLHSGDEAIAFLDASNVIPDERLIFSVIWALREEWKLAFLAFKWGEKWDCVVEKTWCLMIWLLGNHMKFSTSWALIHELYKASRDTQQALLILIDRYAAANHAGKAIETFHIMQKFKFSPDQRSYFTFLKILCEHGNIEEAEEFMFVNKKFFPLETAGFNIILNGWCNVSIDIYEAKRVWREMSNSCILPDGTSYTHLISCHSSVGNLFDSLRLFDEMKKRGWIPGLTVYNSLIYVLTRENCTSEAIKIIDKMKEMGLHPNSTSYNSIIRPLCEASKLEEARKILARMLEEGINPTIDTYHAFLLLEGQSSEGILEVLDHLRKSGLGPTRETFQLILGRSFKLGRPENALTIWYQMKRYTVTPDHALYDIMVGGLAKCGLIVKARELFDQMKLVGLAVNPSLEKLVEEPPRINARKVQQQTTVVRCIKKGNDFRHGKRKCHLKKKI
ncbi:pentatricopeptide repeat-containing protein mitochondrial [Dorcoceras hygrometricum]|uniref:Pentatricopeptide repeat-containing protein mitochondrial n=1 Tax=Dorcoceras hygrometricum TaxID=472368 RepID=A0A2Z7ALH6_9LAMI|nr:pentatricopeptide repeat-containing protein mitochondrial [Dorcoceras hygrometricum]